jgi:hypothetical protein
MEKKHQSQDKLSSDKTDSNEVMEGNLLTYTHEWTKDMKAFHHLCSQVHRVTTCELIQILSKDLSYEILWQQTQLMINFGDLQVTN